MQNLVNAFQRTKVGNTFVCKWSTDQHPIIPIEFLLKNISLIPFLLSHEVIIEK